MDRRYVRLDPKKLDLLRLKRGWNLDEFFTKAELHAQPLDKRTVKNAIDGKPVFVKNAKEVACLLGAEDLVSVLHPDLLAELGPPSGWGAHREFFTTVGEWETVEPIGAVQKTANGLSYDVWKMKHRYVSGRFGRGKCFDLHKLSTQDRSRLREHLTRHGEICDRIGPHRNLASNRSVAPWEHGAMWWVIDDWVEGNSLADAIAGRQLAPDQTSNLMRDTAHGLHALHNASIIRRELAPRHILIRDSDGAAVLTDFELAKLIDGAPTVSPTGDWPDDDYRAIEVEAGADIDIRADVYSWGRIATHAVCGVLPRRGEEPAALASAKMPAPVRKVIASAVAIPRSDRPESIELVLAAIKKW